MKRCPMNACPMTVALLVGLGAAACGDDSPVVPMAMERELPARVAPPAPRDVDGGPPPPLEGEIDYGDCCDVTFAVRDIDHLEPESTARVTLRGSDAPLDDDEGVAMAMADGIWSATVCVPLTYDGTYRYEFAIADDPADETLFLETRTNANVPEENSAAEGTVNRYDPIDSCSDDVTVHADTSAD